MKQATGLGSMIKLFIDIPATCGHHHDMTSDVESEIYPLRGFHKSIPGTIRRVKTAI